MVPQDHHQQTHQKNESQGHNRKEDEAHFASKQGFHSYFQLIIYLLIHHKKPSAAFSGAGRRNACARPTCPPALPSVPRSLRRESAPTRAIRTHRAALPAILPTPGTTVPTPHVPGPWPLDCLPPPRASYRSLYHLYLRVRRPPRTTPFSSVAYPRSGFSLPGITSRPPA